MNEKTLFCASLPDAFTQVAMTFPNKDAVPGQMLRFSTNGKPTNLAGWLKVFPDGEGAVFGCNREGTSFAWQQRDQNARPSSRQEPAEARQRAQETGHRAEVARATKYASASLKATAIWQEGIKLDASHAYLSGKGIMPHHARKDKDGSVMLPVYGPDDSLQSLQFIGEDGSKRFLYQGKMKGGRFLIGEAGPAIVLAEGFATAAAIHEATGLPCCVAFNAGNLICVAKDIRKKYPDAKIIIAGDDDLRSDGSPNTGRIKANEAAQAVGGTAIFPDMGRPADFWDVRHERGDKALTDTFTPATRPRFKLLCSNELRNLPELEWRIDNVLPMQGIGLIVGQSGAGKSFAAIDLLARVALGLEWFGHETQPCQVVYCALEGRAGIKRRVEAWEQHYAQNMPAGFVVVLDTLKLTAPEDVNELSRAILDAGGAGGLIVIDTLAQASPGIDENSSADMGLLIEALQRLQALTGGLVLAVHHMGKDTSRGARGHSSLYAACDAVLAVAGVKQGRIISTDNANGGKSKDAEPVTHGFGLDAVQLHTTSDGREIWGAVAVEQDACMKAELPKLPKGGNAKIVWDKLGPILREAGDVRPLDAPDALPQGRPAIRLDDAIDKIGPDLPVDAKRRTERMKMAITSLMNAKLIEHHDGWMWCK